MTWFMWNYFILKWTTVKFLEIKMSCTLGWLYSDGAWLYCALFIWWASCTVFLVLFRVCIFILICFVCTTVRTICHRVTTQLQLIIIIIKPKPAVERTGPKWKTVCVSGIAVQHLSRKKLVCDPRYNLSAEWKSRVECCSLGPRNTPCHVLWCKHGHIFMSCYASALVA
jgi:hypothetical protein